VQCRYHIEQTRVILNADHSARSHKNVIGMRDAQNASAAQLDLKWLKWNSSDPFSKLFKHMNDFTS